MNINRLPHNATTEQEVRQYFITRALQMAPLDIVWLGDLSQPKQGCYVTHFYDMPSEQRYSSFYVTADHRGEGLATQAVQLLTYPIITVADCNIIDFLVRNDADFRVANGVFDSIAYELIEKHYGDKRAERSKVFLMNHIDEGLYVLEKINASEFAKRAYCLHPLLQTDEGLLANLANVVAACDPMEVALALEYRNAANAWLSDKVRIEDGLMPTAVYDTFPRLSPLKEVNDMLIADKIQNYKDFLIYHRQTHKRSDELDVYFKCWLNALGVDQFQSWADNLRDIVPQRFANPVV